MVFSRIYDANRDKDKRFEMTASSKNAFCWRYTFKTTRSHSYIYQKGYLKVFCMLQNIFGLINYTVCEIILDTFSGFHSPSWFRENIISILKNRSIHIWLYTQCRNEITHYKSVTIQCGYDCYCDYKHFFLHITVLFTAS
jgi:hypothetical protein